MRKEDDKEAHYVYESQRNVDEDGTEWVSCLDHCGFKGDVGWACGGRQLIWTADGGRRWLAVSPPETSASRVFVADRWTCFVLVFGVGGHSLWRSGDSGTTWNESYSVPTFALNGAFFLNESSGWLVLGDAQSKTAPRICETKDGGASWMDRPLRVSGKPEDILFRNAAVRWLLVTMVDAKERDEQQRLSRLTEEDESIGIPLVLPTTSIILRTDDGGQNWSPVATLPTYIHGLAITGNTLFAHGWNGVLFRSTDDGLTWNKVRTGTRHGINAVAGDSCGTTVLVGDSQAVAISRDMGQTWMRAKTSRNEQWNYIGVNLVGGDELVLVGSKSIVVARLEH